MKRTSILITLSLVLLNAIELKVLWEFHGINGTIEDLKFSTNGVLGVASWDGCAYLISREGILLNKTCGSREVLGVDYLSGIFGFVNRSGEVYLIYENGTLLKSFESDFDRGQDIGLISNGFLICRGYCTLYDLNGRKKWDTFVGRQIVLRGRLVIGGRCVLRGGVEDLVIGKGYAFAANTYSGRLQIIRMEDGEIVNTLYFPSWVQGVGICGSYLAVIVNTKLYLYDVSDPSNPKMVWNVTGVNVSCNEHSPEFSMNCKYIAIPDEGNGQLKIYEVETGRLVYFKNVPGIWSVAWWRDRIAVGLYNGTLIMYRVTDELLDSPEAEVEPILLKLNEPIISLLGTLSLNFFKRVTSRRPR
ncbi:hypothetical protein EYM_05240 [Ignicoccus islandicus DSM 13165]|uniref:Uncharacterized protein n=2 Tax=Ignicoccus islandicus TaxID=54259 RepID=A0A0U3F874_9CREN|nr:hypothetical protein EYM_05240 [Ignicoccus islandicus DSM 13165]